jgi:hypothetical protein
MSIKTLYIMIGLLILSLSLFGCDDIDTISPPGGSTITYNNNNNITNNITSYVNITNNITSYVNITNNITSYVNITNNITTYLNTTYNITNNITNNIISSSNLSFNITYLKQNETTNLTTFQLMDNFNFTLLAYNNYSINCMIMTNAPVTVNSTRLMFNYTTIPKVIAHSCFTFTSGTALYNLGATTNNLACATTATTGNNLPTPFIYNAIIEVSTSNIIFNVWKYSEVATTFAQKQTIYKNSYCNINNLN